MNDARQNFQDWFVTPLNRLCEDDNNGFIILSAVLPLLERYVKNKIPKGVIAHPTPAMWSAGEWAASTKRRTSSAEARLAFAVLTTERKAA